MKMWMFNVMPRTLAFLEPNFGPQVKDNEKVTKWSRDMAIVFDILQTERGYL